MNISCRLPLIEVILAGTRPPGHKSAQDSFRIASALRHKDILDMPTTRTQNAHRHDYDLVLLISNRDTRARPRATHRILRDGAQCVLQFTDAFDAEAL